MIEQRDTLPTSAPTSGPHHARFSLKVFDIDTIKKAAYRMSGLYAFDIAFEGEDVVCTLHPRSGSAPVSAEVISTFRTEVLDQDLRRTISAETAPVRNAVLAYAFSRTGLQTSE